MRLLSRSDVSSCVSLDEAIAAVRDVFAAAARGEATAPARTAIASSFGTTLVMPAGSTAVGATVVKVVSVHPDNAARGLRTTTGLLHVLDAETGTPLAVVEAGLLTALRTAAAVAVATEVLARPDAACLGVLGAGFQARHAIAAIARVRELGEVRVFCRDGAHRRAFAADAARHLGCDVVPAQSAADAVAGADIVCAATTSHQPVFAASDLAPGVHVNGIGSFRLDMGELPVELLQQARIVVDSRAAAEAEAGDLLRGVNAGYYEWRELAELGEVLIGTRLARQAPDETTVFKSVGLAIQDLALGALVARRAAERGLGVEVDLDC